MQKLTYKVYLDVPISCSPDETNISSCRWITHSISHIALFKHLSEVYMIGILLSDFEDPHPFVHVGARALLEYVEVRNIHFVSSGMRGHGDFDDVAGARAK